MGGVDRPVRLPGGVDLPAQPGDVLVQRVVRDPRTVRPAQTDVIAATVVAPDGPSAEMAAKVALILGSQAGRAWLDERPTFAG